MKSDLDKLEAIMQENEDKYKNEKEKLHALQQKCIEAVIGIFDKKGTECFESLYDCNTEIESNIERLVTKIKTLQERVNTHEEAQAVYSTHDIIEMDKELKDLVSQYDPEEFDPKPHVLETMDGHECFDIKLEDITKEIENIVFIQQKGKIFKPYMMLKEWFRRYFFMVWFCM